EFVEVGDSSASDIRLGWDELDGRGGAWAEAATGRITRAGHVEFDVEIGFDLAENWYPEASAAADLFYRIALHEIGHAIGLDHRADPTSTMNATVCADGLSAADISAVQALYGQAPAPASGEEPAPFREADIEVVAATYQFFT